MAKRGSTKHMKRIAIPKAIPIVDKKDSKFMARTMPGPHPKNQSIPLGILLRDIIRVADTASEINQILSNRLVKIDGNVRTRFRFPVGFMDVISFEKADKFYRIFVDNKARLVPIPIKKEDASTKILKVTGKNTIRGGKFNISLHDGKTSSGDNKISVGDSVVYSLLDSKLKSTLKLEKGCRCLIREGKHAGTLVKLKDIIQRQGGKPSEALVQSEKKDSEEFITVAKYLFVVDNTIQSPSGDAK